MRSSGHNEVIWPGKWGLARWLDNEVVWLCYLNRQYGHLAMLDGHLAMLQGHLAILQDHASAYAQGHWSMQKGQLARK